MLLFFIFLFSSPMYASDFAVKHQDSFENDLSSWQVEQQPGGKVSLKNEQLIINDQNGTTVWFREKLQAPYIIEYDVTPSDKDRVSDVNCFWMATDPHSEEGLLAGGDERAGKFPNYHPLRLYYVGMGGHNNSKTRFRRYPGDGSRPLRPEHDREQPLLRANETMTIRIVADGRRTQFIRDGKTIFDFVDDNPFKKGYFGFRAKHNYLIIDNFRVLKPEVRFIGPEDGITGFSVYDTSPESPDGSKISYVRFSRVPERRSEEVPAELWICRRDNTNHRKLADIKKCTYHNGANAVWATNERIAYMDPKDHHDGRTHVVDVNTGERVFEPVPGMLGHHSHEGRFLLANNAKTELGPPGLYEMNGRTGDRRKLFDMEKLQELHIQTYVGRRAIKPVSDWKILHHQYSPYGSYISFRFDPASHELGEKARLMVTCDREGNNLKLFGRKPMHFTWYDNGTVMGHDDNVRGSANSRVVRRWNRSREVQETLAGPGNHLAVSPDRNSYASETWYHSDPIQLRIYPKGSMKPHQRVFSTSNTTGVWKLGGHVNPAYSRDGKRLYFFYPVDEKRIRAAYTGILPTARTPVPWKQDETSSESK